MSLLLLVFLYMWHLEPLSILGLPDLVVIEFWTHITILHGKFPGSIGSKQGAKSCSPEKRKMKKGKAL